jgi:2-polyprenyl-6-methoxyphenol hydroxylase-like FAD-dependent oxidoreductase
MKTSRPAAEIRHRAIIVGAGPAGLATAIALRRIGFDPIVYERADDLESSGTGLTLWPNALKALDFFGAAEAVRAVGMPAEGIVMCSAAGEVLDCTARGVMETRFGGTGLALHRAELVNALLDVLGRDTVRLGARCVGFRADGHDVRALFADGTEVWGDLLVGADGIRSVVRAQLLGGGDDLRYAGYAVWRAVTTFDVGRAPGQLSLGRGAQFGLFPMTRGRAYWFGSLSSPQRSRGNSGGHRRLLLDQFAGWHDPIPAILAATAEEEIRVTDIYDRRPLPCWGSDRMTLVGDAAHPSTPNLGQGTCQAFEDAAVLADCLHSGDDVVTALRTYEARRRPRANAMSAQARQMSRLGQWTNPTACWLRNQMLKKMPQRNRLRQLEQMFSFELH